MTRIFPRAIILLATAALACGGSGAEPTQQSISQQLQSMLMIRDRAAEEPFDEATRAVKLEELEEWITRIPGRFRIEGRVEKPGLGGPIGARITGIADCASVGEGVGVQCIFNASWPVIDAEDLSFERLMKGPIPRPSPSEALRSYHPALMVLGLNPELSEVRAMLVTDDSLAHTWAGRLKENTLRASRLTGCRLVLPPDPPDFRCIQPLEIIAEPDSELVTIILRAGVITMKLAMIRDPDARPKKRMRVR